MLLRRKKLKINLRQETAFLPVPIMPRDGIFARAPYAKRRVFALCIGGNCV